MSLTRTVAGSIVARAMRVAAREIISAARARAFVATVAKWKMVRNAIDGDAWWWWW